MTITDGHCKINAACSKCQFCVCNCLPVNDKYSGLDESYDVYKYHKYIDLQALNALHLNIEIWLMQESRSRVVNIDRGKYLKGVTPIVPVPDDIFALVNTFHSLEIQLHLFKRWSLTVLNLEWNCLCTLWQNCSNIECDIHIPYRVISLAG